MSAGSIEFTSEEWVLVASVFASGNVEKAKTLYNVPSIAESMRALVLIAREGEKSVSAVESWDAEASAARVRVMAKLEKAIAIFAKALASIDEADKAYVEIILPQVELKTNPHSALSEAPVRAHKRTGEKRTAGDYSGIVGHYIGVPREGQLKGVWYVAGSKEYIPCLALEVAGVNVWYPHHQGDVLSSWSRCFAHAAGTVNANGASSAGAASDRLNATNAKVWLLPDLRGVNGGTYGATLVKDWREGSCTLEVVSDGDLEDRPGTPAAIAALSLDVEALIATRQG